MVKLVKLPIYTGAKKHTLNVVHFIALTYRICLRYNDGAG
jgi:hypothetical protein